MGADVAGPGDEGENVAADQELFERIRARLEQDADVVRSTDRKTRQQLLHRVAQLAAEEAHGKPQPVTWETARTRPLATPELDDPRDVLIGRLARILDVADGGHHAASFDALVGAALRLQASGSGRGEVVEQTLSSEVPMPLLSEALGTPFMSYILDASTELVSDWMQTANDGLLTSRQAAAVTSLFNLLRSVPGDSLDDDFRRDIELSRRLGHFHEQYGRSLALVIRGIATGHVSAMEAGGDDVLDTLAELAYDVFPLLLLPRRAEHLSIGVTSSVWGHPRRTTFDDAVLADGALSLLFPDRAREGDPSGYYRANTGHGGSTQLALLSSNLLMNGWVLAVAENDELPTFEEFLRAIERTLEVARLAARGETCKIPVRVGLTGALPPEGWTGTRLEEGYLRPRSPRDNALVQHDAAGQLQGQADDGSPILMNFSGDLVLELEVDYKFRVGSSDDLMREEWPSDMRVFEVVASTVETVTLSYMLRDPEDAPLLVPAWTHYFDPFSNNGFNSSHRDFQRMGPLNPKVLNESDVEKWKELGQQVGLVPAANIKVPRRRLLQAAAERADPGDVLVDSVVVWESLLGAKTETLFRVSSALAWLLEPNDSEARATLLREIKRLYGLRSGIVHGGSFLEGREAYDDSRKALKLAALALVTMVRDRPDLLQYKDVAIRSNQLILGA